MDDLKRSDLPPLCEASLDEATLRQVFADLAACTRGQSVMVRHDIRQPTRDAQWSLSTACEALLSRSARGVQVRYHYDQTEWTDTFLVTGRGLRLVRTQHVPSGQTGQRQHLSTIALNDALPSRT